MRGRKMTSQGPAAEASRGRSGNQCTDLFLSVPKHWPLPTQTPQGPGSPCALKSKFRGLKLLVS